MNESPYAPPELEEEAYFVSAEEYSTGSLWIAYFFSAPVAPVLAAVLFFFLGLIALAFNPDDTGTPAGVILVPIMLLTVGIIASYVLVLMLGMSVVFFLRTVNKLSGVNLFWYGALLSTIFGVVFFLIGFTADAPRSQGAGRLPLILGGMLAATAFFGISIMSTIGVFWFLVKRLNRKRLPLT